MLEASPRSTNIITLIFVIVLAALYILTAGCGSIFSLPERITAPKAEVTDRTITTTSPLVPVTVTTTTTTKKPDGSSTVTIEAVKPTDDKERAVVTVTQETSKTAKGVSYTGGNADKVKVEPVSVTSTGATSGGITYTSLGLPAPQTASIIGYSIGALAIIAGAALIFFYKDKTLGLLIAASGVCVIATVQLFTAYPLIAFLPVVALLATGGWLVYDRYRLKTTTGVLVTSIDSLPDKAKSEVTDRVSAVASNQGVGAVVKTTVTATKVREDL